MNIDLKAVDVFIRSQSIPAETLGTEHLKLDKISCRGTPLDPNSIANCLLTDVFQCRFSSKEKNANMELTQVAELLTKLEKSGLHWVQVQNVYEVS